MTKELPLRISIVRLPAGGYIVISDPNDDKPHYLAAFSTLEELMVWLPEHLKREPPA